MDRPLTVNLQSMRVDLVGSLLRPDSLKDAFVKYGAGTVNESELKKAQDDAIRAVVAKQAARDLPVVVDGEFRQPASWKVFPWSPEWRNGRPASNHIMKC